MHRIDLRAPSPGTWTLAGVVAVAYVVGGIVGGPTEGAAAWLGPRSDALRHRLGGSDLAHLAAAPWRLLSAGLVHVTLVHLAVNLLGLLVLGRVLEPLVGGRRLVGLAALGVVAGSLLAATAGLPRVDGASAAVFALLGAGIAVGRRWPLDAGDRRLLVPGFGAVVAVNLAASFVAPTLALSAHTGGLLLGLAAGARLDPERVGWGWLALDVVAAAGVVVGLVVGLVGG